MIADVKLDLFRLIDSLPENLVVKLQAKVVEFVANEKEVMPNGKKSKSQYEKDLAELKALIAKIPPREDWDAFIKEFDESRKDRPLPFRD
jgi:hypothetical protein